MELLVSYVNPQTSVLDRQKALREWGFGSCDCSKCVWDLRELKENEERLKIAEGQNGNENGHDMSDTPGQVEDDRKLDKADLEKELREGFGL